MLLEVSHLRKSFGGLKATDDCSLSVAPFETHAIIGPNGAGKSTLVKQLTGELRPDSGKIIFDGQDVTNLRPYLWAHRGIGRSYQITSVFKDFSIIENVVLAAQAQEGHSFGFVSSVSKESRLAERAQSALEAVGLFQSANRLVGDISHGEQRQLELAMAMVNNPKLLILDEPLAGMGRQEGENIKLLLGALKQRFAILLIEHDMDAVFRLADRVSCLVYGRIIFCGTPEEARQSAAVQKAYLGTLEGRASTPAFGKNKS